MAVTQILEDYGNQAAAWPVWQRQVLGSGQSESRADRAERGEAGSKLATTVPLRRKLAGVTKAQRLQWGTVLPNQVLPFMLPGNSLESHERHTSSHRGTVLCVLV